MLGWSAVCFSQHQLQSLYLTFENYSRNALCALNLISTFSFLSFSRYLCWWTIGPSSQFFSTDMVYYIFFIPKFTVKLRFLSLFHSNHSRFWLSCFGPWALLLAKLLNYLVFLFRLWEYLVKVIAEKHSVHSI